MKRLAAIALLAAFAAPMARAQACDEACLSGFADRYLAAMVAHDPKAVPWAAKARFTENGQALPIGEGLWATASGLSDQRIRFNDVATGQAGVMTVVRENGFPDIMTLRLKIVGGKIAEAETVVTRTEPRALNKPDQFRAKPIFTEKLKPAERRPRAQMTALIQRYFDTMIAADGQHDLFEPTCQRIENASITANDPNSPSRMTRLSCGEQLDTGASQLLSRIRDVRFPQVDEERGLVHVVMMFDHTATKQTAMVRYKDGTTEQIGGRSPFPYAFLCSEVIKVRNGKIAQIEAVILPVPYRMETGWPGGRP